MAAKDAEMKSTGEEQKKEEKAKGDDMEVDKEPEAAKEAEPEEPKELEEDAPADKRPKLQTGITINTSDSTLNCVPTCSGKVLMALSDGGFQHLAAGARATVGVKSGRYLYEVRIVEARTHADQQKAASPHLCKLGFTSAGSSIFLGDGGDESVAFDSEGNFLVGKEKTSVCTRFVPCRDVFGILLNLDPKSPNANTVSLFRDGQRMCKPQPLPDSMKGKVLFPTVNYRNMTLSMNFGPTPIQPLPFTCTMLQSAAKADVDVVTVKPPASGKHEVLFPIALPDEGTFDWLDAYLKENPGYTEISGRTMLKWGLASGLWRKSGSYMACNDDPPLEFGIRDLDGDTGPSGVSQMIQAVTPIQKRNFVAMQVKKNLIAEERKGMLAQFEPETFKRVAVVVMGEPPAQFKAKVHAAMLDEKKKKAAEAARKKHKETADRKQAERAEEEKKEKEAKKEEAAEKDGEEAEEKKDAEDKVEEKKEDGKDEENLEEEIKKAEDAVELTEQEKSIFFNRANVEDLQQKDLSRVFGSFTLPEKSEGFDEIRYVWQKSPACEEYLKAWIKERKLTQRVEDLQPGAWFKEKWNEWTGLLGNWRRQHNDWKDPAVRKRQADKLKWEEEEKEKLKKEAKKAEEDAKKAKKAEENGDADKETDEKGDEEATDEKMDEDDKGEDEEKKEDVPDAKPDEKMVVKAEDMDVFEVEDVCDVGKGEPLFANFTWEDWMLLSLRFELHLMVHAYKHDMDDAERTSFHESHLSFYFDKYYKKQFNFKYYGVSDVRELLEIVKDTMEIHPKNSVLDPQLSDDTPLENLVRLTEDHRRERARLIDAGDESAALHFQKPAAAPRAQGYQQQSYNRGPPAPSYSRGPPPPSRYGSDSRGGSGGYPAGGAGGYSGRGGAPSSGDRYSAPPPAPPSRTVYGGYSRDAPPPPSYGSSAGQKRSYPPPPSTSQYSSGRDAGRDSGRDKAPRTSSYSSQPPPPARGGGSYGGSDRYSRR